MTDFIRYAPEVLRALEEGRPILALESTVITHGLPYPQNLETARALETTARRMNVTPATLAVLNGKLQIGLEDKDLDDLGELALRHQSGDYILHKLAARDLPLALAKNYSGGTTVSATLQIAHLAGIIVFATGGIGGVHRGWTNTFDISADLPALARFPVILITAGCKAILDIPATLEQLETLSVPVYGWRTDTCPAFYTKDSPYQVDRVNDVETIVHAYRAQRKLTDSAQEKQAGFLPSQERREGGLPSSEGRQDAGPGLVVMNPIPEQYSLPAEQVEPYILQAIRSASEQGIHGKALTPYLLQKLADITSGRSVEANLALLHNNVTLGSQIAMALFKHKNN